MKKKIISLLLLMCMMTSCFSLAGCKKQLTSGRSAGERLELTVWETQGTDYVALPEIEDNVVENWLVNKTNVKVKNIYGNDGGQWDPKLTKLVAGNNLPNIVNCGSGQGAAHFSKLNQLGKVWQFTPEILQKYAPDVWRQIPQEQWDKLTFDGEILGIPYNYKTDAVVNKAVNFDFSDEDIAYMSQYMVVPANDVMFDSSKVFWIRDDILKMVYPQAKSYNQLVALLKEKQEPIGEELLDIPIYSTQDYIDFLYKIKNLNLKSNGKTVFPFGYNGGDNWIALTYLGADMYGYKGQNYAGAWNDDKKCIEIPIAHDMVKQAAKTQNQMIRDGVIDPESLAHTQSLYKQKILNGQYAIIPKGYLGLDINRELESMGVEYRYRPFITQVPGQKGYEASRAVNTSWGEALCILNTLSEEEMHRVLNWINVQFTDEYQKIKAWGPKEAGLYTEKPDGTREFKDERFTQYYVENNQSALEPKDSKGLNGPMQASYDVGLYSVNPSTNSRWSPRLMIRQKKLLPVESSGFMFKIDSEHVKNVKKVPQSAVWAPEYANLKEVVAFWSAREQWEDKVKLAFASDSGEQFEKNWTDAMATLNEIVDIGEMERKMTEIARKSLK